MRTLLPFSLVGLLLATLGAAPAPEPQNQAPFDPSVRMVYESDTRAYYRPCG